MVTRCAALAKGATKQTVTSEEKGLHRTFQFGSFYAEKHCSLVSLTPTFAEFDIPGDSTGVLQSGIPFINLHHYLGGTWVRLLLAVPLLHPQLPCLPPRRSTSLATVPTAPIFLRSSSSNAWWDSSAATTCSNVTSLVMANGSSSMATVSPFSRSRSPSK